MPFLSVVVLEKVNEIGDVYELESDESDDEDDEVEDEEEDGGDEERTLLTH